MNQILINEKIIVTPEFKKKRKIYKFNCFLFSFLAIILCGGCIYAEYDRNKSEEVSQDILLGVYEETSEEDNTTISVDDDVIVVNDLAESNKNEEAKSIVNISELTGNNSRPKITESVAEDGTSYYTEAILKIPRLGIEYPVLSDSSDELLKISLNKLWGPNPNEVGNYVIVGHNYKNGKMFGKLPGITIGDTFTITDLSNRTVTYKVYKTYIVEPTDTRCTSQLTNGKKEATLITCANGGKQRLIVKGEAI